MDTENLFKAAKQLVQAFRQIGVAVKELMDRIAEVFACLAEKEKQGEARRSKEKQEKGTSPRKYGVSLISCGKKIRPYTYRYIPIVRRHLPYQRRRF